MVKNSKTPFYREDDDEFIGFVAQDTSGWEAQTIFGLSIARTESKQEAIDVLLSQGLGYLMGIWQYFDVDDKNWYPCVIQEASEHKVTVIRTNAMGYQDPDDFKLVTIKDPTEDRLIKSS